MTCPTWSKKSSNEIRENKGVEEVNILSQPLTTEEGFLNEACLNELEMAIQNMPPIHERLADDPEWNTRRITSWREIIGYFANWSVRQIEHPDKTPFPPGLEKMVGYLAACLRPHFDRLGYAELSLCEISILLYDILMDDKTFSSWNDASVLTGWLDLHALLQNVCLSIRSERRESDAFDKKFNEEHASENH